MVLKWYQNTDGFVHNTRLYIVMFYTIQNAQQHTFLSNHAYSLLGLLSMCDNIMCGY